MIYCENTTIEQLREVPLVRPAGAGSHWAGMQHGDLIDTLDDSIMMRAGWSLGDMKFSLSADQFDMAATCTVNIDDCPAPDGQSLSIGLLTSNARRRALTMVVGTEVAVCTNGMCTGEIVLQQKHVKGADLFDTFDQALTKYHDKAKEIKTIVAGLQERELVGSEPDQILMEAGRRKLLSWGRIGHVDAEYRSPRHTEHGTGTAWCMLNAFTEIVKAANPLRQMAHIDTFRTLLPAEQVA